MAGLSHLHKMRTLANSDVCSGSSRGRGSRAAGWFDDFIEDQNDPHMKSLTLMDGIKGWRDAGEEYIQLMDEYQEHVWQK